VGIGAPVCTRAACLGCNRLGVRAPASITPITGSTTSLSPSPPRSTLRTAYPSMAAWSKPGIGFSATTSSAHIKPWDSAIGTRTGLGATAAAATLACCSSTDRTVRAFLPWTLREPVAAGYPSAFSARPSRFTSHRRRSGP
jgi:hypothetical protein